MSIAEKGAYAERITLLQGLKLTWKKKGFLGAFS